MSSKDQPFDGAKFAAEILKRMEPENRKRIVQNIAQTDPNALVKIRDAQKRAVKHRNEPVTPPQAPTIERIAEPNKEEQATSSNNIAPQADAKKQQKKNGRWA